jgi:hypothetical protein
MFLLCAVVLAFPNHSYGARGGHCYDPASLLFLEVAAKVDGYPDYASFCHDLEQADKGRRYRELAGLDQAIPRQDSFSNFRKRVGHAVVDQTIAIMVQLFIEFGLIKGEIVSTDGQLEPTHSRFKGCAYACQGCQGFPIDEACRQDLAQQLQSGGLRHRMSFQDHPRLIGPIQRGSQQWQQLYAMRSASERTNSYDQEVMAKGSAVKMRGLAAFSFAGSIRTLGQLLRRACNFVLDATYTLGRLHPLRT